MSINAICDSCLKPLRIDYGYDKVIIHQCPLCDKSGIVVVVPMSAPSTASNIATAAA